MRTLLALPIVLVADFGLAQGRWSVELYTGASFKAPTTLEIRKDGHEPGTIDGVRYDTRAFVRFARSPTSVRTTIFCASATSSPRRGPMRASRPRSSGSTTRPDDRSGDDPDDVVQDFELSDGVNDLLANGAPIVPVAPDAAHPDGRGQRVARLGVGPVITKPAATARLGLGRALAAGRRDETRLIELATGLGAWTAHLRWFLVTAERATLASVKRSPRYPLAPTALLSGIAGGLAGADIFVAGTPRPAGGGAPRPRRSSSRSLGPSDVAHPPWPRPRRTRVRDVSTR